MSILRSDHSDARLVAAYRAGDRAAFDAIHERYRARLERFARRLLGRGSEHAEDVVQEAMLRASLALLRDDRPMQLKPWLFRIVRNCALDELSRVRREPLQLGVAEDGGVLRAGPGSEPAASYEDRTRLRELLEDIADLPEAQRHALVRREVDGLSHGQVAAELGLSVQATKSLVFRARSNLVNQREARSEACADVRNALLEAADAHKRAPAAALRHLAHCTPCRAFRRDLRRQNRAAAMMVPAPLIFLGLGGISVAGKGTGVKLAAGAVAAAGVVGLGTQVYGPGDPAPQAVRSPAVPTGTLAAGQPLPAGTAIVRTTLDLEAGAVRRRELTLACPPGLRVADLLTPKGARLAVGYATGATVGADRVARVVFAPTTLRRSARVTLSMLCKRPTAGGSIVAADARAFDRPTHRVRVGHALLHTRPGGPARGSVRRAQPIAVRATSASGTWRRVVTDRGERGWLPADVLSRSEP